MVTSVLRDVWAVQIEMRIGTRYEKEETVRAIALRNAIQEAERFLEVARQVKVEQHDTSKGKYELVKEPSKESAACKRASMDLTRALSDLRRP